MESRAEKARALHLRSPRSRSGQSLVETAITLPVVLLLALGVTDIGRAFYYREAVTNSVRQALRVAVSPAQQATADSVCSTEPRVRLAWLISRPICGASSVSTR